MNLSEYTQRILAFREARDWKQFHNPKDLALSLTLEAAEVLEHFQWKTPDEIKEYLKENKDKVGDELADVFYWVILMAYDLNIDIMDAAEKKLLEIESKYPADKVKGSHAKYTEYEQNSDL